MVFYQRIKEMRLKRGWTQKQLAEAAHIAVGSESVYERGEKVPPVDVAQRISAALGVSLDWLFNEQTVKEDSTTAIRNYGDVARVFLRLASAGLLNGATVDYLPVQESSIRFDETELAMIEAEAATLGVDPDPVRLLKVEVLHTQLGVFLEGLTKLIALQHQGIIGADILEAWAETKLKELDQLPIQTGENP